MALPLKADSAYRPRTEMKMADSRWSDPAAGIVPSYGGCANSCARLSM
jgi:hypothetical protein